MHAVFCKRTTEGISSFSNKLKQITSHISTEISILTRTDKSYQAKLFTSSRTGATGNPLTANSWFTAVVLFPESRSYTNQYSFTKRKISYATWNKLQLMYAHIYFLLLLLIDIFLKNLSTMAINLPTWQ